MSDNESAAKRRKTDDLEDSKADSLSIEETNKLRAKLGLAPLEATSDKPADDGKQKSILKGICQIRQRRVLF